ncbi:MAG: hypothetical protein AB1546_04320 [bacterium]
MWEMVDGRWKTRNGRREMEDSKNHLTSIHLTSTIFRLTQLQMGGD